jgi:hypothetical protein
MMNRSLLQRQMFANGGAALKPIPAGNKGLPNLPKEVRNKMGYMQEGGVAGLMQQQDMAAMPMGSPPMDPPPMAAQQGMDPNLLMGALENAAETTGDLEQASDFESMMNQFSGGDKSEEERRTDLASIVGPEDASQTPDSVLALVTPVVQMAMVDEGIAPMAREAMDVPVEGDMAGGIMSMTGAGSEPPENFKLGGEVRRRGDEDPVQYFQNAGVVVPMTDYKQEIGETAQALLPTFQKFMPTKDPELAKKQLQSDILFDIANTALAFSAPMPGERAGMSPVERLAFATQQTKLLPTISARTAQSRKEQADAEQAARSAAVQAAVGLEQERLKTIAGERKTVISGNIDLLKNAQTLAAKKAEGVSSRAHAEKMQTTLYGLKTALEKIKAGDKFKYDTKLAEQKGNIEKQIRNLQAAIDINKINIQHEDNIEKINLEYGKKEGIAELNNIASLERKIKQIESNEKIADKKTASNELIAKEKNNTQILINENNNARKDARLTFDKKVQEDKLNQLDITNAQALLDFDLKKAELERKKLADSLKYETDQATLALKREKLEKYDLRLAELKEFETLSGIELKTKEFEFKQSVQNDLNKYRDRSLDLKAELNQITRANNVMNQKYKKMDLDLKTQAAKLELFGKGVKGRVLNIITDANRYTKYAEGAEDNVLETAIQDYIQTTTDIKGQTVDRELPPYLIKVLKSRINLGLTIPNIPLDKLNLNKEELESLKPITEEKGTKAITQIIDPDVDLTNATGFISSLKTAIRFLAGQVAELGFTEGDIFKETSSGRKMLNALANATERFIREATNDRLDVQSLARLQKELVRPSGFRTDADALAQLRVTQDVMKKTAEELNFIINNPKRFKETSIDKARKALILTNGLINEYGTAIRSYERFGGFDQQGSGASKRVMKNIFKRRQTN